MRLLLFTYFVDHNLSNVVYVKAVIRIQLSFSHSLLLIHYSFIQYPKTWKHTVRRFRINEMKIQLFNGSFNLNPFFINFSVLNRLWLDFLYFCFFFGRRRKGRLQYQVWASTRQDYTHVNFWHLKLTKNIKIQQK